MVYFFFFKQKTAYEMRISDWSSDVCSSDLPRSATASPPGSAESGPRWRALAKAPASDERRRTARPSRRLQNTWVKTPWRASATMSGAYVWIGSEWAGSEVLVRNTANTYWYPERSGSATQATRLGYSQSRHTEGAPPKRCALRLAPLLGDEGLLAGRLRALTPTAHQARSEEHTSEHQSLMRTSYAVFCLQK